jgi:hypothetical protein
MNPWSEAEADDDDGEIDPDLGEPPPPRVAHPHPGLRRLSLVAVLVVSALGLAALAQVAGAPRIGVVAPPADDTVAAASPVSTATTVSASPESERERTAAIEALLESRAQAVVDADRASWAAAQVDGAVVPLFDRLVALPLASWRYAVGSIATTDGDAGSLDVTARLAYRFDGETDSTVVTEQLTVRQVAGTWLVATERTEGRRAQPWDLGEITVVRGKRSVVIGIDRPSATLARWADIADAVVTDVSATWGTFWARKVVVIVPRSTPQLARALARTTGSLETIAAVTTTVGTALEGEAGAARVWLNTPLMASLSGVGRAIVLRHEVTHVATRATSTDATPLWLEEGFAEFLGYEGSGVTLRTAVADLVRAVRAGRAPSELPSPDDFSQGSVAVAYESAHVAAALVVENYGVEGLLRLYRLSALGQGTSEANVDSALREVTGSGLAAFTAAWRARVAALSG